MTDATAKYILTAEDRTQNAIRQAKQSFDRLNDSARMTGKGISALTQLFVGAGIISGIRRFTDSIVAASRAADKDFAGALDSVKASFDALLVPQTGLDGATVKMKELADTLKDPAVVAAADQLTSSLISGLSNVAIFAAKASTAIAAMFGHGPGGELGALMRQVDLKEELARITASAGGKDRLMATPSGARNRAIEIERELATIGQKSLELMRKEREEAEKRKAAEEAIAKARQSAIDAKVQSILLKNHQRQVDADIKANDEYFDSLVDGEESAARAADKLAESISSAAAALRDDLNKALDDFDEKNMKELTDKLNDQFDKTTDKLGEMSEYAKRAAQNMQDVFADFLFDPFQDGLSGMLKGFIDVIRRMVAEAAAAKIFDSIKGSGSDGGGGFLGTLGKFFAGMFADGGTIPAGKFGIVGERGPELAFAGSSPMQISPGGGGGAITINMPVDARGATVDAVKLLPDAMKQASDHAVSRILEMRRKGRL